MTATIEKRRPTPRSVAAPRWLAGLLDALRSRG